MSELVEALKYGFAISIPCALVGILIYLKKDKKRIQEQIQEEIKKNEERKTGKKINTQISKSPKKRGWKFWERKFWKGREETNTRTGSEKDAIRNNKGTTAKAPDSRTTTDVTKQRGIQTKPTGSDSKPKQHFH